MDICNGMDGLTITVSTGSGPPEVPSYSLIGGIAGPQSPEVINTEILSSSLGAGRRGDNFSPYQITCLAT